MFAFSGENGNFRTLDMALEGERSSPAQLQPFDRGLSIVVVSVDYGREGYAPGIRGSISQDE
jgi:hypothetical protein